jgi:hypothetical protein
MPLARKVLWIVDMDDDATETAFGQRALAMGATHVCIRTSSTRMPAAIARFKGLGLKVYAWRWPGVIPGPSRHHYYAFDEARFVAEQLIPNGLDGYIVDPESDGHTDPKTGGKAANDWDQASLAPIAREFCATIRTAAAGKPFVLGTTSGCGYPGPGGKPHIPFAEFFGASDVLLPQTYWRWTHRDGHSGIDVVSDINGGTPAKSVKRGDDAWGPKSGGRKVIPMAGEVDVVTPAELAAYGDELAARGLDEGHFYADNGRIPPANLAAMKAL